MGAGNVLGNAAARIGYYAPNDPRPGSEAGRYLADKLGQPWLRGPSTRIWWCACFVSMCMDLAGERAAIGGLNYNTMSMVAAMRRIGCARVDFSNARAGDVIFFDWDGNGCTDHVGLVERNLGSGWVQTIEGNTSSGTRGSQSAGNGVWRRRRTRSGVYCIYRPHYTGTATTDTGAGAGVRYPVKVDGWFGKATIHALQHMLSTSEDSTVSSQPVCNKSYLPAAATGWEFVPTAAAEGSSVIARLQSLLGVAADGYMGPGTVREWQSRLGVSADGYMGRGTVRAIQSALNHGNIV